MSLFVARFVLTTMTDYQHIESFTVDAVEDGTRLDAFLNAKLPDISRSKLQKAIEEERVSVNGDVRPKRTKVHVDDTVRIDLEQVERELNPVLEPQNIPLEIIYEDEHFVAVNKQTGLVVHPGSGNPDGTLVNALMYHVRKLSDGFAGDRPGIVHRLDKDTTGVLIVAKSNIAHAAMSTLFSDRMVYKEYVGICTASPPAEHDIIDTPIGRSRQDPVKLTVRRGGKQAVTEYWLEKYHSGIAVFRFRLHTGRTHQVRVHCRYAGFPIVSDNLYGGGRNRVEKVPTLERPFAYAVHKCFDRHALHSRVLEFEHPFTKKNLRIEAPLPADFQRALELFPAAEN